MAPPDEYSFCDSRLSHTHAYLGGPVFDLIAEETKRRPIRRVFELGCGNGSFAAELFERGFDVSAIDVSTSGIEQARTAFVGPRFEVASAYDDLALMYGKFDLVICLEVVEHLYSPRKWAWNLQNLLLPGGLAVVSTPYHGYLKNLALALAGKWDSHMNPLWDHGHIKLWSVSTLSALLKESGLRVESVKRVGRLPMFAKSMVVAARLP